MWYFYEYLPSWTRTIIYRHRIRRRLRQLCEGQGVIRTNAALRRGNTRLIEALMDYVNQTFAHDMNDEDLISHGFVAAEEQAIQTLVDAGFAEHVEGWSNSYRLNWGKLEARKKMHRNKGWRTCVKRTRQRIRRYY